MANHDQAVEAQLKVFTIALKEIANHSDCWSLDEKRATGDCDCPICIAKGVLSPTGEWKFIGARAGRQATSPRERKLVESWRRFMGDTRGDQHLAQILNDGEQKDGIVIDPPLPPPIARDWYVATSIIQWLGTNVGSSILMQAGWEYTQYNEDRVERDKQRAEKEPEKK